mmetsp:Transcript_44440/g.81117  ORF Transcript_44440/g.81117 Transcript_44440/m.81117 type:complete len:192 (+) Transcript_44440:55-630(+)
MDAAIHKMEEALSLLERATGPEILVRPFQDKVQALLRELTTMRSEFAGAGEADLQNFTKRLNEISELSEKFVASLQDEPWAVPASLKALRTLLETTLSSKIYDLHTQARRLLDIKKEKSPEDAAYDAYDEAVMTLDSAYYASCGIKTNVILHAAGVQVMTPFTQHSPSKFEFLLRPKGQATYQLHQLSTAL